MKTDQSASANPFGYQKPKENIPPMPKQVYTVNRNERAICVELFDWLKERHPEVEKMAFHLHAGTGDPGSKSGLPDYFIAYPCGRFHGLYLEMKKKGGNLENHQYRWLKRFQRKGYQAFCCYGLDDAKDVIEEYLEGSE